MGRVMFPDQLIERRMQVDRATIKRYADVTNDYNPIHLDPEFAAKTPMGGTIAHGMLSLSLLWQSLQATFGTERMAGVTLDIRFIRPVRENDWVTAGGQRSDDGNGYQVWVRAQGSNRSEVVISGAATIKAPKRLANTKGALIMSKPKVVLSRASDNKWETKGLRSFLEYRNLGIEEATEGKFGGSIARALHAKKAGDHASMHYHTVGLHLTMVLRGWMRTYYDSLGEVILKAGDCVTYSGEVVQAHTEHSDDFEVLQITMPAEFPTVQVKEKR